MRKIMERKRNRVLIAIPPLAILLFIFLRLPVWLADKPEIMACYPEEVMENSWFNAEKTIQFSGKNFDNIVAIYVNGTWEPNCTVLSQDDEKMELQLPSSYFSKAGKLKVQFQRKVNSDIFVMSNAAEIRVLSNAGIEQPKIKAVEPDVLAFDGTLITQVILKGDHFTEDSVVTLDDKVMSTKYHAEDQSLSIGLAYSDWYRADSVQLRVVQYYDGYPTSIDSSQYNLITEAAEQKKADAMESEDSMDVTLQENHQILLNYLSALSDEKYIVLMAVKDESSCAVTEEIVQAMRELGLKEGLNENGVHQSYIAVIDGTKVVYEKISSEALDYDFADDNHLNFSIKSENFNVGNTASIIIDGIEYAKNSIGLNIVVFDKTINEVVDSVAFNTYSGLELTK